MTRLFLALMLLLPQASAVAQSNSGDWLIERLEQARPMGTNSTLEIRNEYGDIRCRAGAVDEVKVISNAQRLKDDPLQARVEISEDGGRLLIEVDFVGAGAQDGTKESNEMKRRRIDLTVIMPAGAKLIARTHRGLIEAKGLENRLDADSTSGNIVVSTAATVKAHTRHGSIKVGLNNDKWETAPSLETLTGDIELWLPLNANLKISAETQGRITTDFSIDIRREATTKLVSAKIGKGGKTLRIKSTRGDVLLFQATP